jgi:hypothetical protein
VSSLPWNDLINDQEISMTSIRILLALSAAVVVGACATTGGPAGTPPMAGMTGGSAKPAASTDTAAHTAAMDARMKTMRETHDKMMNARTPEERSALRAVHMKEMQDGMQMMKGMGGMASHQSMMDQHMQMMQMMMDTMKMDGVPPVPVKP